MEIDSNCGSVYEDAEQFSFRPAITPWMNVSPGKLLQAWLSACGGAARGRPTVNHDRRVSYWGSRPIQSYRQDGPVKGNRDYGTILHYVPNSQGVWEEQPYYCEDLPGVRVEPADCDHEKIEGPFHQSPRSLPNDVADSRLGVGEGATEGRSLRPSEAPPCRFLGTTDQERAADTDASPGQGMQRLQAIGLMTTGIAHDLGNMAQVVASAVHCMERKLNNRSSNDLHVAMTAVHTSVDRLGELVRRIVHLGRPDPSSGVPIDLHEVFAGLKEPLTWLVGPSIRIRMSLDPNLVRPLCGRHELEDVIINLSVNARDAMPEGGDLTVHAFSGDSREVTIEVRDTGIGMDADTAAQALRPFFTTKFGAGGTGLGLAMVQQFAERTGGRIDIDSAIGVGTVVRLRLPAATY